VQTLTRIDESQSGERAILLGIAYQPATRYVSSPHVLNTTPPGSRSALTSDTAFACRGTRSRIVEFAPETRTLKADAEIRVEERENVKFRVEWGHLVARTIALYRICDRYVIVNVRK